MEICLRLLLTVRHIHVTSLFGIVVLASIGCSSQFKGRNACSVMYEGCNIAEGRCVCDRTLDRCYNLFAYNNVQDCRNDLFTQTDSGSNMSELYPPCMPAQLRTICHAAHVQTKYCHGSCNKGCCVIAEDGCLPPTNVYVPASACAAVEQDVCQGRRCTKGYRCESVKPNKCPVLPCRKLPICVVDDNYDPCPLVRCPQGRGPKICIRRRSNCSEKKCPFTFGCHSVTSLIRLPGQRAGCPNCPRMSLQESYCKNHFAARVKVKALVWEERFHKLLGICNWYSCTVEYVVRRNAPYVTSGNATLLVTTKHHDTCSCLANISVGERYLMIGVVLGHAFDGERQMLHVPTHGFIKPWQVVKRRPLQYLGFEDCPKIRSTSLT